MIGASPPSVKKWLTRLAVSLRPELPERLFDVSAARATSVRLCHSFPQVVEKERVV
jgi:hypothetical protein